MLLSSKRLGAWRERALTRVFLDFFAGKTVLNICKNAVVPLEFLREVGQPETDVF